MKDFNLLVTEKRYQPHFKFWSAQIGRLGEYFHFHGLHATNAPEQKTFATLRQSFPTPIRALIERLAPDELSRFVVLAAVLQTALSRYCNLPAVVLKTPLLERKAQGRIFVEEVMLLLAPQGCRTVRDLLLQVKDTVEKSYDHQGFPVEILMDRKLNLNFFRISNVLFFDRAIHRPFDGMENFDLRLEITGTGENLALEATYACEAFEAEFLTAFLAHVVEWAAMFETPDTPLAALQPLSGDALEAMLQQVGRGPAVHSKDDWLVGFERRARQHTVAVAVAVRGETTETSYGELNATANRLARYFGERLAVGRGDLVGIHLRPGENLVLAMLAVLKTGAAFLPVDPDSPVKRNELILNHSKIKVLITDDDFLFEMGEYSCEIFGIGLDEGYLDYAADDLALAVEPQQAAYVMHTSGSAGKPKGVVVSRRALANYIHWAADYYFEEGGGSMPLFTSPAFDLTLTSIFYPLTCGATIHTFRSHQVDRLLRVIFEAGAGGDTVKLTPSHITMLRFLGIERTVVRKIIAGGEELTEEHLEILRELNPEIEIYNEYGPTETTVGCTVECIEGTSITIGRPVGNTQVRILDRFLQPLPAGCVGGLYIAGPSLARGYLDLPGLTAERFIPDPLHDGERLYDTGDMGKWLPDGSLDFLGRGDAQIKFHGNRIEPTEIEFAMKQIPGVSKCVVEKRHDRRGQDILVAYYVARQRLDGEEIKRSLGQYLIKNIIPTHLVPLRRIPLTLHGKLNRRMLPDPEQDAAQVTPYKAPRTDDERGMVQLWCEVFSKDTIGVADNFFQLGGHSLKAVQLSSLIHKEMGRVLEVSTLFSHPTIADLCRQMQRAEGKLFEAIEKVAEAEHYAVSRAQRRLWIASQLSTSLVAYSVPAACILTGALDAEALEQALNALVARHESLRTVFVTVDGEPRQKILSADEASFTLEHDDLRTAPDREARAQAMAEQQAAAPFNLEQGPLLRAQLIRLGDERHLFLFSMHHIITDGVSMNVLVEEALVVLYRAFRLGQSIPLPSLPFHYKDYAVWESQQLAGPVMEDSRLFWLQKLARPETLRLPTDFERPAHKKTLGKALRFSIAGAEAEGITALCRDYEATPFMVFLTCVNILLYRFTGQQDLMVGTPVSNRYHADLEQQIGLYLNTLVLRNRVVSEDQIGSLLERIRSATLAAFDHQHYPFDRIVEEVGLVGDPSRSDPSHNDPSRNPLFDVGLTMQSQTDAGFLDTVAAEMEVTLSAYGGDSLGVSAITDLWFVGSTVEGGFEMQMVYDQALFRDQTAARIAANLQHIIATAASDRSAKINSIQLSMEEPADAPRMVSIDLDL